MIVLKELSVAYDVAKDFITACDVDGNDTELSDQEFNTAISRLERSGDMDIMEVEDTSDFIWNTVGGIYDPIGPDKLAQAIVAGGWTYTFCDMFDYDC